jgi:uncharacterized protein YbaR (Trm112 family)
MNQEFHPELLKSIRCPVTKSSLREASDSELEKINSGIQAGTILNHVGQTVTDELTAGFINEDQTLAFSVRKGIVILVADQAIRIQDVV